MTTNTPDAAAQTMINNLPEKTGKSLQQWLDLLSQQNFAKHGEIVKWLKSEHAVTHGFANLIAHSFLNAASPQAAADPVAAQYSGPKAALRPINDAVIAAVRKFGDDVEIAPKKAYVSLRRSKQFALCLLYTSDAADDLVSV